jgi:hypothetical protein
MSSIDLLQVNRLKVYVYQTILELDKNNELNDDDLLKMADQTIEIICNNKVIIMQK